MTTNLMPESKGLFRRDIFDKSMESAAKFPPKAVLTLAEQKKLDFWSGEANLGAKKKTNRKSKGHTHDVA
ncbi:hypothetical protein [Rhodospira trueperi]|uniref:Uncharacterized protein n=1 Tax=Rhodospira trueperi TaxID=69960 RepID=A0A1G7F7I2_9PROT|nr:hypothetical protein [Rhodospira trueperi]SDE71888.1 hypothetical protein SAMN05421720_110151 [Rhodospira trueperi]